MPWREASGAVVAICWMIRLYWLTRVARAFGDPGWAPAGTTAPPAPPPAALALILIASSVAGAAGAAGPRSPLPPPAVLPGEGGAVGPGITARRGTPPTPPAPVHLIPGLDRPGLVPPI